MIQRQGMQFLPGIRQFRAEFGLHPVKRLGVGALEGIDGLLLVANDKNRALDLAARTCAAGKLFGQLADHVPLGRACVLRLVHEDMINTAVQTIQHPGRDLRVRQQLSCLQDQVVKIEPGALLLGFGISGGEPSGKLVQLIGVLRRHHRQMHVARILDPLHQGLDRWHQVAGRLAGGCGRKRTDLRCKGRFGLFPEQEDAGQGRYRAQVKIADFRKFLCGLLISRGPGRKKRDQIPDQRRVTRPECLIHQTRRCHVARKSEDLQGITYLAQVELPCIRDNLGRYPANLVTTVNPGKGLQKRCVGAVRHLVEQLAAQQFRCAILDLGELRTDACFQWKPAQERGAERVDCLDLEPARCLDRAGKERTRLTQVAIGHRAGVAQFRQRGTQRIIIQHRPFAQTLEQAVLHLGGGGLGVGQAQDVLWLHAVQQQARHTVRQHARLS